MKSPESFFHPGAKERPIGFVVPESLTDSESGSLEDKPEKSEANDEAIDTSGREGVRKELAKLVKMGEQFADPALYEKAFLLIITATELERDDREAALRSLLMELEKCVDNKLIANSPFMRSEKLSDPERISLLKRRLDLFESLKVEIIESMKSPTVLVGS